MSHFRSRKPEPLPNGYVFENLKKKKEKTFTLPNDSLAIASC